MNIKAAIIRYIDVGEYELYVAIFYNVLIRKLIQTVIKTCVIL